MKPEAKGIELRAGERIVNKVRFLASHSAYAASLKGKAREAYQNNLDTYHRLKNTQENEETQKARGCLPPA